MPARDVSALLKDVKAGRPGRLYLLVGEDTRRMDAVIDAIEAVVDPADRPFAVDRLYAGEAGGAPVDIAASARILPMLGDRRIVIVLRAERILKPKRAARRGDADDDAGAGEGDGEAVDAAPLEDYIASPAPFTTLVFAATEVDRSRRFTKRLVAAAEVVEFGGLESAKDVGQRVATLQTRRIIDEELARHGRTIDAPAADLLAARSGGDINRLRGDLERLLLYAEGRSAITSADVAEVSSAPVGVVSDEWAVVNAIASGDPASALTEVGRRFDRGDSPHALVGQLRWWVSSRMAEANPRRVPAALDALLRTDLALKSSGGDERALVELLVVELARR